MRQLIAIIMIFCLAFPGLCAEATDQSQTVKVGYVNGQAPFASSDAGGPPVGYAIDLCNQATMDVGKGVPPVFVQTTLAEAFDAVSDRRIDLLCGAITANLARRAKVDFSQPIFVTGASALLRTDSPRDLRELFSGERTISPPRSPALRPFAASVIGVRSGTSTEVALRKAISDGGYTVSVVEFATHTEGLAALESRSIDAYFGDRVLLAELMKSAEDPSSLVLGARLLTHETYGIAMRRDDPDLRLRVDRALSKFYGTEGFSNLLQKYFGVEASTIKADILARRLPD